MRPRERYTVRTSKLLWDSRTSLGGGRGLWAGAALLASALLAVAGAAQAPRRPNVVVILADDMGWGDLGCYGHPKFKTPNIDRMAAEGVRLTQFYSTAPYCAPTRAALQTGRYQFRSGLTANPLPKEDPANRPELDAIGLPPEEITLGDAFHGAGYRTSYIGKWHLGHRPQFRPLRQGYDEYYGILYSNDMHRVELIDGDRVAEYPVVQATLTRRYTERVLAFLDQNRERPFLLFFAHAMPHKPLAASEEFYGKSSAGLYGDAMSEVDWSVGRVLEKLAALGLEKNTLVLFASDNGPWYGGSTGGLRGMKGQTWEGGLRVPLIARWPGRIPAGRTSAEPGNVTDLFSTCLATAGIPEPKDRTLDGRDLTPVFASNARSPHEALFAMQGSRLACVRSGKWKLHVVAPGPGRDREWKPEDPYVDPRRPDGVRILAPYEQAHPSQHPGVRTGDPAAPGALFDLESDPAEQKNVAAEHPDVVQRLRALYEPMQAQLLDAERQRPPGPKD